MVIPVNHGKLLFVFCNILSDLPGCCKVKYGSCYRCKLSCRNRSCYDRRITGCPDLQKRVFHIACLMACQIKVAVIGHVDNGILITFRFIMQLKFILFGQGISHLNGFVSGEAHGAVCISYCKGYAVCSFGHIIYSLVISFFVITM